MTTLTECQACGIEPLENAWFCHGCGSPVAYPATYAEYKQVTVLFADVVLSMDIAATVGAERVREIMANLADRCAAVVHRYRGTVAKFTGDGIMARLRRAGGIEGPRRPRLSCGLGVSGGGQAACRRSSRALRRGPPVACRTQLGSGDLDRR